MFYLHEHKLHTFKELFLVCAKRELEEKEAKNQGLTCFASLAEARAKKIWLTSALATQAVR
jgi:hypothetical protein